MVVIPPRPSLGMALIMQHIEIGFATGTRGQSHRDLTQASTQLIHAALIIHPPMCTRRANPPNAKIRFERWSSYSRGSRALPMFPFFEKQRFSESTCRPLALRSRALVLNPYLCREFRNVLFYFLFFFLRASMIKFWRRFIFESREFSFDISFFEKRNAFVDR